MTNKVYSLGYAGRTIEEVKEIAERLDAVIFDVRLAPWSKDRAFCRDNLRKVLGLRYTHVAAFGNKNYRSGGPVELVDFEGGLELVKQSRRPVILMCACFLHYQCHRARVSAEMRRVGIEVELIKKEGKPKAAASPYVQLFLAF